MSQTHTPEDVSTLEEPPSQILGILQRLGPGLIIAGSIVGSGELIGTTTTGAQAKEQHERKKARQGKGFEM